jgi:hypothetical protein
MRKSKRNTIRLREISGRAYTNAELMSDRLGPYIQVLRTNGVNAYTRFCSDVRWSGTVGDDEYFEAPCTLDAFISMDGAIVICAALYDGYITESNPLGLLIRCFDAPLSYYERQLLSTKPGDIGMSILIDVK